MKHVLLLVALSAIGCGKEVGRVTLSGAGSAESTIMLTAKDVALWTEMDVEWTGHGSGRYDVEILQSGKKVASATCDFLRHPKIREMWVETNLDDRHTRRGRAKLDCSIGAVPAGESVVRVTLQVSNVTVRKADLVVKQ